MIGCLPTQAIAFQCKPGFSFTAAAAADMTHCSCIAPFALLSDSRRNSTQQLTTITDGSVQSSDSSLLLIINGKNTKKSKHRVRKLDTQLLSYRVVGSLRF